MRIEVVYAHTADQTVATLELAPGATVADALAAVASISPFSEIDLDGLPAGIHGRLARRDAPLTDGDRVELYRPLVTGPREARRRRAERLRKSD